MNLITSANASHGGTISLTSSPWFQGYKSSLSRMWAMLGTTGQKQAIIHDTGLRSVRIFHLYRRWRCPQWHLFDHRVLYSHLWLFQTCFVSQDYGDDLLTYMCNESECEAVTDLDTYDLPAGCHIRWFIVQRLRLKLGSSFMIGG